jgi:hypothetical protein
MDIDKNIKTLTFGVSFSHKFKLLDSWGEIADNILYHSKLFSPELFPRISANYTTERKLYNEEKQHYFVLTASSIVFNQEIESNYSEEFHLFKERVNSYIVPKILSENQLLVDRLGMVYTCSLKNDEIKRFAGLYFKPDVDNIVDFRFSKRESCGKATVVSGNTDFINKIFTVGNVATDVCGISYDYQLHFSPPHQDVRDTIDSFINDANKGFASDISNRL